MQLCGYRPSLAGCGLRTVTAPGAGQYVERRLSSHSTVSIEPLLSSTTPRLLGAPFAAATSMWSPTSVIVVQLAMAEVRALRKSSLPQSPQGLRLDAAVLSSWGVPHFEHS